MNSHFRLMFVTTTIMFVFLTSCTRSDDISNNQQTDGKDAQASKANGWEGSADAYAIGVDDEQIQSELDEAASNARESAKDASKRWQQANPIQKENWLIKWAAPIHPQDGNKKEYVWVTPVEWSQFRVEGKLVTRPTADIGLKVGDLIAFPIEELYDWVYKIEGDMHGPRLGGFTVDVLEKHFGIPNRGG